ncbi:MAG: hypothetical protein EON60_13640 [Alphaproteobacteria bacterium]|nr:MAG: hypothetical protein EON60_13640 [Alphaproteobacteria bacterium]
MLYCIHIPSPCVSPSFSEQSMSLTEIEIGQISKLEELLDYAFRDRELALHALSVPTIANGNSYENYQYLEFYGDRVYNLCVITLLNQKHKMRVSPRKLDARMKHVVSNSHLAKMAQRSGLTNLALKDGKIFQAVTKRHASDIMEAVYGAVFIDSGNDFATIFNIHLALEENTTPLSKSAPISPQQNAAL